MWIFYVLSLIPLIVGLIFWVTCKKVHFIEWIIGSAIAFLISFITHAAVLHSATADYQTFSGRVLNATFYPRWVEQYTDIETDTDSEGRTHNRTVTRERTHIEYWIMDTTLSENVYITQDQYNYVKSNFNNEETKSIHKPGFIRGDKNIYVTNNNGVILPITETRLWSNRLKAAPSLWDFAKVPKDAKVFDYPPNKDVFNSDRLVGEAKKVFILKEIDILNAELGPSKKVNLIFVGFPKGTPIQYGTYQESKWIGGKRNDLVICWAGGYGGEKPEWVYVFGWTEKKLVRQNLQTLLLDNGINRDILPKIKEEVVRNYQIKDWSKFDYITIEPPKNSYVIFIIVMIISQVIIWIFFFKNQLNKNVLSDKASAYRRFNL